MKNQSSNIFWLLLLLLLHLSASSSSSAQHHEQPLPRQVYIVYIGEHSEEKTTHEIEDNHHSYLFSVKDSKEEAKASLIYSYKNVINGFSALLTQDEASKLSEMKGVVSVFRSHPKKHRLHTTRSWDFISLLEGRSGEANHPYEELLHKASYGKDVIVGMIDSGIWPESQSFSDEGMEPIPKSWKGKCQTGVAFNKSHCNRKLIGARYYIKSYEAAYGRLNNVEDYRSPRDKDGHGTHTTSIVGGRRVMNASAIGGFAYGTASGGAPLVRLAIYKTCWPIPGQPKSDGITCQKDDMLAGIDDAIADGVQVLSISIGSNQSNPYTQDGIAIGALHLLRNIVVACSAGNSGPTPSTVTNVAPWIITVAASSIDRVFPSPLVLGNQMKIQGQTVTPLKLRRMHQLVYAQDVELPGTTLSITGNCLPGTLSPKLVKGKIVVCLGFNVQSAMEVKRVGGVGIVLPDITALGLNILAAWSEAISPTQLDVDHRVVNYNLQSGTSMACPHVAAVSALLKAIHPNWSSAGIRSALMTTGHFQPANAADPGLVYDATYTDHLLFLCSTGYHLDPSFKCPKHPPSPSNLNYPSLAIAKLKRTITVKRTVTNVGASKSVYSLTFKPPIGFSVEISPTILSFSEVGEKRNFFITVKEESRPKTKPKAGEYAFGWYMWSDGIHRVRSPIAVSSA
ncbi:Subtilisin-like protease SBT5.6 [Camellia lanceoleosa]|uniref:Subtilisin-like protease SBT5.6 n=1 Tax=Camellia lanceoleosa TaxID=1840588 RepID=A0ACC0GLA6_9ERIC|nr:Subtilisin-like protease SBT5.6 [Camellia lanceoleosa]